MENQDLVNLIKKDDSIFDYNVLSQLEYTNIPFIPFIKRFNSNKNIKYLTGRMILENNLQYDISYDIVNNKIKQYIQAWINLGKFDDLNLQDAPDDIILLDYYNKIFIDAFCLDIKKQFNIMFDTNPYKELINGKTREMMNPTDYENMDVQKSNDMFTTSELFNKEYNKIPWYEKAMYVRNVDTNPSDGFTGAGQTGSLTSLNYKDFPQNDMKAALKKNTNNIY